MLKVIEYRSKIYEWKRWILFSVAGLDYYKEEKIEKEDTIY